MPYNRETAGKGGHADFVRNPDVQTFLAECDYLRVPSAQEADAIAATFVGAPTADGLALPEFVVSSDASKSDTAISDQLPSTQVGFIKVSHVLIEMSKYGELIDPKTRFVDPFKVAELHRNAAPITYTLPGSNIRYQNAKSVKDGFRRAVFCQLSADKSQRGGGRFVLTDTLLFVNSELVVVSGCPSCDSAETFSFTSGVLEKQCGSCSEPVFVTDWLRLHEDISDFGDNTSAMTRMMNAIEHLLMMGLISQVFHSDARSLSRMAFVMDGPLAIFGQPAKLHSRIMVLLFSINRRLGELGLEPLLVMGLQKAGVVMDHAKLLERFLPPGVIRLIDDDYRNDYIKCSDAPAANFGAEVYWGQDFLFKTERGRMFNFALPYPFSSKQVNGGPAQFARMKAEVSRYGTLVKRACDLIRHFELDLYESAIVPVALAHRHASISLVPGGKVLDIVLKAGLSREE
jgi:hypothetical protein